ncbi:MAG: CHAT domain-containing protein [Caulobacteraceae bacterium]
MTFRGLCAILAAWGLATAADAAAARADLSASAFEYGQMASSSRAAVALAQSASRLATGDPSLLALVRSRQDAEARWRAADTEFAKSLARSSAAAQAKTEALRVLVDEAAAEIARADKELAARYPDFADLTSPAPLSLKDAQALLKPDEALVFILPAFDGTYVWAVRHDRSTWARGALNEDEVAGLVRELRAALDPSGVSRAAVDAPGQSAKPRGGFPRATAYKLYQSVWAPAEPALGGVKTVYVVAAGALGSLPLSILPASEPKGDDADPAALRKTDWLFRRHALANYPSVATLRLAKRLEGAAASTQPFAGFGDPELSGPEAEGSVRSVGAYYRDGGGADVSALKSLPRLKGSRNELLSIARTLGAPPSSVVVGAAATETAVKSADLSNTRVLAFATHGLVAGEIDGLTEPALVLSPPETPTATDDGLLTLSEAAALKLNADWVVLSACNTAASDGEGNLTLGGEGLSGLARAFLYAGGKALLVSHWRVRDDAAAKLTTEAVRAYARHPEKGRAEALRQSMLKLMADKRVPGSSDPAVWAPFMVVGR